MHRTCVLRGGSGLDGVFCWVSVLSIRERAYIWETTFMNFPPLLLSRFRGDMLVWERWARIDRSVCVKYDVRFN